MRLYPQYSSSEGKKHHKNRIMGLTVTNNIENRLKDADSSSTSALNRVLEHLREIPLFGLAASLIGEIYVLKKIGKKGVLHPQLTKIRSIQIELFFINSLFKLPART